MSEGNLAYSYKALEFPDDKEYYSSSLFIRTDWESIIPILNYVRSLECAVSPPMKVEDKPIHLDSGSVVTMLAVEEETPKGDAAISKSGRSSKRDSLKNRGGGESNAHIDLRYLYFLKKVCNLTKKDARVYCQHQNKLLVERSIKNKAKVQPKKRYLFEAIEDSTSIHILACSKTGGKAKAMDSSVSSDVQRMDEIKAGEVVPEKSVILKRALEIKDISIPPYDRDEFGYLVYKHGDDLVSIAKGMKMDLKDVILVYYFEYCSRHLEITGSLLEKYVEEEWTITDRILFEENFMKYGTKFNKFMINKSEVDLRIYYRYYLKNYIPINWTEQERAMFSLLFSTYKKDWNSMQKNFPNKTPNDLRVFYGSYFKKLDEEERIRESQLAGGEEAQVKTKKRGRKPGTTKLSE